MYYTYFDLTIYTKFIKKKAKKAIIITCKKGGTAEVKIKKLIAAAFILAFLMVLSGCSPAEEEENKEIITNLDYDMIDLSTVVDKIYSSIELSELTLSSVAVISDEQTLTEQFYLDLGNVVDCEVRSAEGNYGVADVAVLRVKDGAADAVMASLESRKDDRINEFSKYDVYDSYDIALNAAIYQADEFVVMLMLSEEAKTTAMEIIDSFMP